MLCVSKGCVCLFQAKVLEKWCILHRLALSFCWLNEKTLRPWVTVGLQDRVTPDNWVMWRKGTDQGYLHWTITWAENKCHSFTLLRFWGSLPPYLEVHLPRSPYLSVSTNLFCHIHRCNLSFIAIKTFLIISNQFVFSSLWMSSLIIFHIAICYFCSNYLFLYSYNNYKSKVYYVFKW